MFDIGHIFTLLFLMLGPFKIIGPFKKITARADLLLTRKIAFYAILYSSTALLIAALVGERILSNYGIPIPILSLAAGIILFLVALLNIIRQFEESAHETAYEEAPTLNQAMYPLAFPTIVTPYGIAAVIVFMALAPDLKSRLLIGGVVVGIMLLNLIVMLLSRRLPKIVALVLALLGAILGMVQVALGLQIVYRSIQELLKI